MELEDRIVIATPEGVELGLVLAGAGSRCLAAVFDLIVQTVLAILAAIAAFALIGGGVGEAIFFVALFVILYLYYILFEVLGSGRTPGKRLTSLRVVRERGTPVTLSASAIRNLLRLVDLLPGAYLVGMLSILFTRRNQRLGDLAAGTLVIRDRKSAWNAGEHAMRAPAVDSGGWDVSAVSDEELAAVRHFLARRVGLDRVARVELSYRLEQGLRLKVSGAPTDIDPELFLEALAVAKARR